MVKNSGGCPDSGQCTWIERQFYIILPMLLVLVALAVILCQKQVLAADWSVNPSISLSQTYDDNLLFSLSRDPLGRESDFVTKLIPVLSVSRDTEVTKFRFDTTISAEEYIEHPSYDTVNTNTRASVSRDWSSRFSTDGSVTFIHDSTLEEQLEQSGIRAVRTERYHYELGLSGKYAFTDRLSLQVSGTGIQYDYPSGPYPNSTGYQVGVTPVWLINPRNSIGLSSTFNYTDFNNFSTIDTFSQILYWQRLFGETVSLKVGGGYEFTTVDTTVNFFEFIPPSTVVPAKRTLDVSDSSPIFTAELKKDWSERFSTTFSAGSNQYNSADARSYESTFAAATGKYMLSERTTLNLDLRYNYNTETSSAGETIQYFRFTPSIERKLNEKFTLRLSGSYERENEQYQGGTDASGDRFRTWIDLTYTWPRIVSTH